MPVLLQEERVLGQAVSGIAVWEVEGPKAGWRVGRGRVRETVLLSVLSLRPLCLVSPSWVFRVPSKERGFACLKLQGPPNPSAMFLQQLPCFSRNVKFDGH